LKGHKNKKQNTGQGMESLAGESERTASSQLKKPLSKRLLFLLKGRRPFKLSQQGPAGPCTPFWKIPSTVAIYFKFALGISGACAHNLTQETSL
ncbi:MAG: hypothetical protein ACKO6N_27830, partial [Myxococcota bacterium]